MKKYNRPLSEKEKRELEELDNPNIKYFSPAGGIFAILGTFFTNKNNKGRRKERVVNLRTRIRINELRIDPDKNYQEYYKIVKEEEERFDKKFKDNML